MNYIIFMGKIQQKEKLDFYFFVQNNTCADLLASFHLRNDIKQDDYIHCSYAVNLWYAYILKGNQNVLDHLHVPVYKYIITEYDNT